jgi:hypothetical protein
LKTAILDTELVNVPTVRENGTTEAGNKRFRIGIRMRLAPPPQMALSQNAKMVPKNNKTTSIIIFINKKGYTINFT